ncbi:hypothetical protein TNCV_4663041 [Trichonephila clavipes]|uniref:Uncharacterized protein n=1 Tax=Trichonephila clavipes TaxID=2585209 RepID=A0A8X6VIM7_TRICX|nr:hypothetical protein TNCV_4663041 [Trichonephila clavipes]
MGSEEWISIFCQTFDSVRFQNMNVCELEAASICSQSTGNVSVQYEITDVLYMLKIGRSGLWNCHRLCVCRGRTGYIDIRQT